MSGKIDAFIAETKRLRRGGALLCALVVILVFEGLQNDGAASERAFASEKKSMSVALSENVIVVQTSKEPQTGGVATDRADLRSGRGHGRTVVSHLRPSACPDHIFGKIFSGGEHSQRIDRILGYHRINNQFPYYSWGFPIISESIGDTDVVAAGNAPAFVNSGIFNERNDIREVVFIDDNIEAGALYGDRGISGVPSGFGRNLSDGPHLFIGLPQGPSEQGYGDGGDSSQRNAVPVKEFRNLNENERRQVVTGAVFVIGLCFVAYLGVRTR